MTTNKKSINTTSSSNLFGTVFGASLNIAGVTFNAGLQIAGVAIDAATQSANIVCSAAVKNAPAAGRTLAQAAKVVEKATIGTTKNAIHGTETVCGTAAQMANATAAFVATATPVVTATACNTVGSCWAAAKALGGAFVAEYKTK